MYYSASKDLMSLNIGLINSFRPTHKDSAYISKVCPGPSVDIVNHAEDGLGAPLSKVVQLPNELDQTDRSLDDSHQECTSGTAGHNKHTSSIETVDNDHVNSMKTDGLPRLKPTGCMVGLHKEWYILAILCHKGHRDKPTGYLAILRSRPEEVKDWRQATEDLMSWVSDLDDSFVKFLYIEKINWTSWYKNVDGRRLSYEQVYDLNFQHALKNVAQIGGRAGNLPPCETDSVLSIARSQGFANLPCLKYLENLIEQGKSNGSISQWESITE